MTRAANRSTRLLSLKQRLSERPLSVVELADLEDVGRRTIERDLIALEMDLGVKLVRRNDHRFSIPPPPSTLNAVEALALYSAARLLQHTGIGESHYRTAMRKLAQQVPEPARSTLLSRVETLKSASRDRVLDQVAQAWFQRRVLRCTYHSVNSGESSRRDLEIYLVELSRSNNEAYALAFDRTKRRQVVVFKLARMQDVRLLDETYEVPKNFDPETVLKDAIGIVAGESIEVHVNVAAGSAKQFRELSAGILVGTEAGADGSLIATVRGTLDSNGKALELVPWLLGWGDAVEVLDPPAIREEIAAKLAAAAAKYTS